MNLKIFINNLLDSVDTLTASTSAPYWPVTNVQKRWKSHGWRSAYGSGSGGGRFEITTSNNKFSFYENGAGPILNATLTSGVYNADGLASEIETQMESAGANTYTVTYNKSTFKFEIYLDTGTSFLIDATSYAVANNVFDTIGFTAVMAGYGTSKTGDEVRIHTEEYVTFNFNTQQTYDLISIFGHNLTSTGAITVQFSTDNFTTISEEYTLIKGSKSWTSQNLVYIPASSLTYDDIRFKIVDVDNPDGYSTLGRTWAGVSFMNTAFAPKMKPVYRDPSIINKSIGGQVSVIRNTKYKEWNYALNLVPDIDILRGVFESRGFSLELVILEKTSDALSLTFEDPEDNIHYCRFTKITPYKISGTIYGANLKLIDEL